MSLSKHQLIAISATFLLVLVFYFGCETKNPEMELAEKSRAASFEVTSIENIRKQVFDSIDAATRAYYDGLQIQINDSFDDSSRVEALKGISGFWFKQGEYALSGNVAEEIAKIEKTAESWSIAGTTYATGIKNANSAVKRTFNRDKAVNAFEQAISLEPDNLNHQVNLAVSYAELPTKDNPMRGIVMLLDLNKKDPDDIGVLYQLARFGMQTNQYDKAIGRLNRIMEINPDIRKVNCLLAQAYQETNQTAKAAPYLKVCNG